MNKCQFCGDDKGTFDIAHVCSKGQYAVKPNNTNTAPDDVIDWEGVAADQALTIVMLKVGKIRLVHALEGLLRMHTKRTSNWAAMQFVVDALEAEKETV